MCILNKDLGVKLDACGFARCSKFDYMNISYSVVKAVPKLSIGKVPTCYLDTNISILLLLN